MLPTRRTPLCVVDGENQLTTVSLASQWKVEFTCDGRGRMRVGTGSPTIKGYNRYDPFGRTLASGGSLHTANAMRFSSKPAMGSSDLYYYGYRFYDPSSPPYSQGRLQ